MNELKAESGGPLIYLVDDEPMLLELGSVILEPLGYTVETYRSPESALRAFEVAKSKPALIVTDYAMHNMTGMDLAAACRQISPDQKVLLVSGTVGSDVYHGAALRPDHFLAKPYQSEEPIDAVAVGSGGLAEHGASRVVKMVNMD